MSKSGRIKVLKQRILTALLLVPLVLLLVLVVDRRWFALVVGLVVVLGAWEWSRMVGFNSMAARSLYVVSAVALLGLCSGLLGSSWIQWVCLLAVFWWIIASMLIIATQQQWLEMPDSRWLKAVIGLIVLVPAWLSLVLLHDEGSAEGRRLVMVLFLLIWTADIAAYFAGKRWGKTPLANAISPGKTWEGVFGGMLASVGTGYVFTLTTSIKQYETIMFLLLCLVTISVSVIGDLFESLMKRRANLKDSGNILPGHGGVLDRIDSLTAASPVFLTGLWLTGLFS